MVMPEKRDATIAVPPVISLVLLTVGLGCMPAIHNPAVYYCDVSVPVAVPPEIEGVILPTGHVELRFDSLVLRLSALDAVVVSRRPSSGGSYHQGRASEDVKSLMLLLEFRPAETGYSFNPIRVSVTTATGEILSPHRYGGPGRVYQNYAGATRSGDDERTCEADVGNFGIPNDLPVGSESTDYILPQSPKCFVLAFDAIVSSSGQIGVTVAGLSRNGTLLAPRTVQFSRGLVRAKYLEVRPPGLE
jgi:hypothetical protein